MIDHEAYQLACRAKLMTLVVASTGSVALAASSAGGEDGQAAFTRAAGDFKADGLRVGLEVLAAGFDPAKPNNARATIVHLTPLIATVARWQKNPENDWVQAQPALVNETAAGGRILLVGVPGLVSWENKPFDPMVGRPYLRETYLPGGATQRSNSPKGILEVEPTYMVDIFVPKGTGISADGQYSKAIQALFAPQTYIPVPNGDVLKVRGDIAPQPSQRQFPEGGFAVTTFAIPLRLHTPNSL